MKLPRQILLKLTKCIAMLNSPEKYESEGAVDAMRRILQNHGFDFNDLAAILEAAARALPDADAKGEVIAPKWSELTASQREQWISNALYSCNLKDHERDFLTSIREYHHFRSLTQKQIKWADSLIARTWNGGRYV